MNPPDHAPDTYLTSFFLKCQALTANKKVFDFFQKTKKASIEAQRAKKEKEVRQSQVNASNI